MIDEFTEKCKGILEKAINKLTGCEKRKLLAEIAEAFQKGGQRYVAKEFKAGRNTIRKGMNENRTNIKCKDAFNMRGRKKITEKMPSLERDLKAIIDPQSQIDPKFQSERLYSNLSISSIRKHLIEEKGYKETELPTNQTLNNLVNNLGYSLKKVKKTEPLKKIPETDAIFENLHEAHEEIADDETVLRISIDTKDRVKIGNFSRGGNNRIEINAKDHDFCDNFITTFGIIDVKSGNVKLSLTTTKVTADFIADRIEEYWKEYGSQKKILFINADNGPENSSNRTQYIKRMVEFSAKEQIKIVLGYYPPYHSKYNPIERVWGALEQYWNGNLLDSIDTILHFATNMTYRGLHPKVEVVEEVYQTGIKLTPKLMKVYESALERKDGIEKWFVKIIPSKCMEVVTKCSLSQ